MLRFLFLLSILISISATAQPFCGNFNNPNRRNKVKITDLKTESQQWQILGEPGVSVKLFFREPNDSVIVYRDEAVSGHFLSHNDRIISLCLVLRDEKGNLQSIDSFRVNGPNPVNQYYGSFTAAVYMHREYYPSGIPSKVCYKNGAEDDSLEIEWSPDGIIRRRKLPEREYFYASDGVLSMECSWNDTVRYMNGIITSVVKDTLVLNQLVSLVREYSTKGTLLKEKWFKDQKPVATWREYNAEGVLMKTIKHPALVKMPVSYEVMEAPYPEVFAFVTESVEFPGGKYNFDNYMSPELQSIFSAGDFPLQGNYTIRFEIAEDGTPSYVSVQGENAIAVESSLKSVFEKMPRWKPAKRSGRAVNSGMMLTIKVSEG